MIVDAVGLDFDDLFVLLDGEFEDVVGAVAAGHVAKGTEIDAPEKLVGFEIFGIALDDVLSFEDGVSNASGLNVKFGEASGQKFGGRIGVDGKTIFLDRFVGEIAAAINRDLLLVHMSDGVVVIGGGAVLLVRRRLSGLRVGRGG